MAYIAGLPVKQASFFFARGRCLAKVSGLCLTSFALVFALN